jgi:ribonuclease R
MRSQIGLVAEGRVMEIMPTGVIVALDAPFVDVRVSDEMLGNDAYEAADDGLSMVGRRSGDAVWLGDRMKVRVEDVSLARRSVMGRRLSHDSGRGRGRKKGAAPPGKTGSRGRKQPIRKRKSR